MGFESLKSWLNKPENSKYSTNIECIFFLDSFASKPELYLQIFQSEQENNEKPINSLLEVINNKNDKHNIKFFYKKNLFLK